MIYKYNVVIIFLILCVFSFKTYSNDSLRIKISESAFTIGRNINIIDIPRLDTFQRVVIPHKVQPTIRNTSLPVDSMKKTQSAIQEAISRLSSGQYAIALISIYEAKNFLPHNSIRQEAIIESYYGIINIEIGSYNKAAAALNRSDSLIGKLGDSRLFSFHYNNLGLFYQKFKSEKTASNFFNKALSISRLMNDEEGIAISLNNKAKGDSVSSKKITYLEEAIAINKKLNNDMYLAENYNNMAFQYCGLNEFKKAEVYLKKANQIAQKYNMQHQLLDNYNIASKIYASTGRYKEAYQVIQQAKEQSNIISANNFIGDIEELMQNRIISKKNYQIDLQKQEVDINRLMVYLIVTITLFVIASLSLLYINSRRKIKEYKLKQIIAEKEIEHGNNEIVNIATFLSGRNDILNHLQQMLNTVTKLTEKEIRQELKKMSIYIKSLQSGNEEVSSLIQRIAEINEEFITRLSTKHPQLTKNEKNIALLLRANLTTKQIAILMDCNPKSINMARYRMRQHLEIDNDTNLNLYLKTL